MYGIVEAIVCLSLVQIYSAFFSFPLRLCSLNEGRGNGFGEEG